MFHQLSNTVKQSLMLELTEDERASHTFNPLWFPVIDRGKKVTTTQLSKTHCSLNSPEAESIENQVKLQTLQLLVNPSFFPAIQ